MIKLQLPRDHPIRQAIDLGRDRFIGPAHDPMRPRNRERALAALFDACYPGMPRELWNVARRYDDGTLARAARQRIQTFLRNAVEQANRKR